MLSTTLTERVQRLKDDLLNLEHTKYREVKDLTILDKEETKKQPLVIRKALGLALLLDETPPIIVEEELIVGRRTLYGPRSESQNVWGSYVSLPVKPATRHLLNYFPHYALEEEIDETKKLSGNPDRSYEGYAINHIPYGVRKVLLLGFGGIKEQVQWRMRELEAAPKENSKKIDFLQAVVITLQAVTRFVEKHADEAERIAKATRDPQRREELMRIAETCRWVSVNTPRTFYEALQLYWFGYLIQLIENYNCQPIGRFDQDLYPYYKKDFEKGLITRAEALELLECLFINFCYEDDLTTDSCANITLSGQDSEKNDVTNELTYMCLDAALALKLADPKINVRFHQNSPPELLRRCCELIRDGGVGGFPSLYNDEAVIPAIQRIGIPLEDALLYSADGCQETIIPGKGDFYPVFTHLDLLDTLNRVLQGPVEWENFQALMEAYKKEMMSDIKIAVNDANVRDTIIAKISPVLFLSSTLEGCIENAMDKTEGGATYNYTGFLGQSLANAANSLAVVKHLVYDDKIFSLTTLRDALAKNWEGYERLRQLALNKVPKYGNDDDYVDSLAVEIGDFFIQEVLQYWNPRGGRYYPGFYVFNQISIGKNIAASPDGRRNGDTVSIHASPTVGTDVSGPTAVINSAAKIGKLLPPEGAPLDLRVHPSALEGEEGLAKLMAFVRTYLDQGGFHLQFNVIDSQILRDAQKHPEQYRDLVVRVWGFSAYFVTLTSDYQENVIARAEHRF
jgi:formate C-acetyltransferase